jgi:hypothetical protein
LRIGADQRPQGFTILGQRPLGANDLLARGQLLGLGIGDIHAILHAALGPVLMGLHRERAMPSSSCSSAIFWKVACMAK